MKRARNIKIRRSAMMAAALLSSVTGAALGQTYASKAGDFNPDGSTAHPYGTLAEAACAAQTTGVLSLAAGEYGETFYLNQPMTIEATKPAAGEERLARIGQRPAVEGMLNLITYNTHLFGDVVINLAPPLPEIPLNLAWKDAERAAAIGSFLATQDVDFVGLQEVWDPDAFKSITANAGYFAAYHGASVDQESWEGVDLPGELNSGLALLSRLPGLPMVQISYAEEAEFFETLASKGYLQTTVIKGSFSIGVFNTHMQAHYGNEQIEARSAQIDQLAAAVQAYRQANPSHPVVVIGDFNVIGDTDVEYTDDMTTILGTNTGLRDAARNLRCLDPGADGATSLGDNDLNIHFAACSEPAHSYCLDACVPVGVTCDALCYAAGTACSIPCYLAYQTCQAGCTVSNEVCGPLCGAAIDACAVGCSTANCLDDCCGGFCTDSPECRSCVNGCYADCQLDCDDCVTGCESDCFSSYLNCLDPCYFDCDGCRACEESCDANHCGSPGPDRRLDYVLYASSLDGSVELTQTLVEVLAPESPAPISDGAFSTKLLSDHNAIRVEFRMTRP